MHTTSPASITINGTGAHYFICNFTGHCSAGQKLMINVSAATATTPTPQPSSSPAPQPSTPTPVSAPSPSPVSTQSSPSPSPSPSPASTQSPSTSPSPAPSSSATTYIVGDSQGWTLTSNTATLYQNWAANKTFNVGDILVFNYPTGAHDVAEVTKANYDSCTTTNPISINSTPPTRITLTAGEHYYVCAVPGHCTAGQKLSINVTSSGSAPSPGGSTTSPPSPTTPSPAGSNAPPPSENSARSLSVAGFSATFLSIVVALLY